MTEFGEGYEHLGSLKQSDMLKCPFLIMDFYHYRPDGTCKCDDPQEQARMIAEWDYTPEDFNNEAK
jgi:hypothetical protein